jgi:hypothetical protein
MYYQTMTSINPVFIIGAPRSGTTFLASLLDETDYGAPFETQFIIKYYKKLDKYGDITEYNNFCRLINDILKERAVRQHRIDIDIKAFYEKMAGNITYSEIVNQLCLMISSKYGNTNWGDKTPSYIIDLDILYELFPDAKYLYIIRDGRDVALSLLQKEWGPNNFYYAAKYWKACNSKYELINKMKNEGKLLSLKYEYLVDDVVSNVKNTYSFLNIDYSQLDMEAMKSRVISGNYYKWKSRMSDGQIKVFDCVAYDILKQFDYEISAPVESLKIPGYKRILYFLHEKFLYSCHMFKMNVIDGLRIRFFGMEPFAD